MDIDTGSRLWGLVVRVRQCVCCCLSYVPCALSHLFLPLSLKPLCLSPSLDIPPVVNRSLHVVWGRDRSVRMGRLSGLTAFLVSFCVSLSLSLSVCCVLQCLVFPLRPPPPRRSLHRQAMLPARGWCLVARDGSGRR